MIANLTELCWARVIVDDFDTIRLPPNATTVKGISTIYISATRKISANHIIKDVNYKTASELLANIETGCSAIQNNRLLFDVLNVRNSEEYIKETITIPKPKYHAIKIINKNSSHSISKLTTN